MLQQYTRNSMLSSVYRAKVKIVPNVRLYGADENTVYLQQTLNSEPVMLEGISGLVLNLGHTQNDSLFTELSEQSDIEVHGIGDCMAPRTVEEATLEALRVASKV
jgi:hypothetical protein